MPYHDTKRPLVNYWFASSNGRDIQTFNRCLSEENQDRLEEEGGVCIMYAHFAFGFCEDGRVDPRFAALMRRLAKKNGWFVPVHQVLDHLRRSRRTPRDHRCRAKPPGTKMVVRENPGWNDLRAVRYRASDETVEDLWGCEFALSSMPTQWRPRWGRSMPGLPPRAVRPFFRLLPVPAPGRRVSTTA